MKQVHLIYMRRVSTNEVAYVRVATSKRGALDYVKFVNNDAFYKRSGIVAEYDADDARYQDHIITTQDARDLLSAAKYCK